MVRMRGGAADFMTQGRGHFKKDADGIITVPDDMVGLAEANGYTRIDGSEAPAVEAVEDPRAGQIAALTQQLAESAEVVAHLRQELETADEKRGLELSTSLTKAEGENVASITVDPKAAEDYHQMRHEGLNAEEAYELVFAAKAGALEPVAEPVPTSPDDLAPVGG